MTTRPTLPGLPDFALGMVLITSACGQIDAHVETTNWDEDAGARDESSTTVSPQPTAADDDASTSTASQTTRPPSSSSSANTSSSSNTSTRPRDTLSTTNGDDDTSTVTSEGTSTAAVSDDVDSSEGDATSTEATSTTDSSNDTSGEEVPMTDHCAAVAVWDAEWTQWEDEVLLLVNDYRAEGADCGEEGVFGPADPLEMDELLRCSSRLHSLDMFDRMYFDHVNPDGLDPFDRMDLAGFSGSYMGENIAMGQTDPEEVMTAWIDSDGHCSNVLNTNYTLIGVGYYPGSPNDFRSRNYWTQNFGAPPQQFGGGMGGGRND